ncbi:MAG: hypothetical protein ACYCQK_04515 [Acidiferrobacteraceae bacterium]
MSDHFNIKIPKPRITLYGLLITAIVVWGAYSIFWKKPDMPKHTLVLPPTPVAPSLSAIARQAGCVSSPGPAASVTAALAQATHKTAAQLGHELNAHVRCPAPTQPASAGTQT